MAFTDPPYNVDYGNSAKDKMRGKDRRILNDALGDGFYPVPLRRHASTLLMVTKGACYVCMSSSELHTLQKAFTRCRWQVVDLRHLGQEHFHARTRRLSAPVRAHPLWLETGRQTISGAVTAIRATSGSYDKPRVNDLHPTMKPVELVERAITNSSKSRDIVLDLVWRLGHRR